jgi:hypothetical protein
MWIVDFIIDVGWVIKQRCKSRGVGARYSETTPVVPRHYDLFPLIRCTLSVVVS